MKDLKTIDMTQFEKAEAEKIKDIILGTIASKIGYVNITMLRESAYAVTEYIGSLNQTEFRLLKKFLKSENTEGVSDLPSKFGDLPLVGECNAHGKTDESISATDECGYEKITDDESFFCFDWVCNEIVCDMQCDQCEKESSKET